jgi:hypothetical protein
MPNQRSIQAGLQPSRVLGVVGLRQLPRDKLDGTQPTSHYQLTRLYETLTKSSLPLSARPGPVVRRRRVRLSTGHHRSHPSRNRPPQSLNAGVARKAIKYAAQVLVVVASFVLGLNFERFSDYATPVPDLYRLAIYHLSGQACNKSE